MNCSQHRWYNNRGSNDKPCSYCSSYPVLTLRYQCELCLKEACKFCLEKLEQEFHSISDDPKIDRKIAIELRVIDLENRLRELEEIVKLLVNGNHI